MKSMTVALFFAVGLVAPAFAAWGAAGGSWASAPVPANIVLSQDGRNIVDTPEVAQARAAHLAALAQAQTHGGNSNDDGSYDSRWEQESYYQEQAAPAHNQWNAAPANQWNAAPADQWNAAPADQWNNAPSGQWRGPPANIALSPDGKYVLDTPEVAKARAAHLASYSGLQTHAPAQQWNAAPAQQWNAAPAQQWNAAAAPAWNAPAPVWNAAPASAWNHGAAPAPVADTPEVAQAKAAHAAAHAAVQQAAGPSTWNGAPSWQSAPAHNNWAAPAHNSWSAAPSQISLSHDGQNVLDTPEVAAAKSAHLAAHAAAAAGSAPARHW